MRSTLPSGALENEAAANAIGKINAPAVVDEARIRRERSGNLCRCTGYVGIVRAIQRVLKSGSEP